MRPLALAAVLACPVASAQPLALPGQAVRYDAHAVVRITIDDPGDAAAAEALGAVLMECSLKRGANEYLVPRAALAGLEGAGLDPVVLTMDVQARLDAENARLRDAARAAGGGGGVAGAGWFEDYKTFTQIYSYCTDLSLLRPDIAMFIQIGQSLEGRPIFGLKIKGDAGGRCVPTLLLNSCQHAREWITPMVTVYAADHLIRQYGIDPDVTALVDSTEVIIIPVANPDGYEYTWSVDRFWRKNRRNNGNGTFGIDLNRNWSFEWGHNNGSSGNTNSETYRGPVPFSEPETTVLSEYAAGLPALRWHNDIHSAAQLVLQPWGWTGDLPPDHPELDAIGANSQALIQAVHNKIYTHGTCFSKLYPISGGASDWFYGDQGVPSFLYELRGPGFDPPPSNIILGAEEMLPALLSHAAWIAENFPFQADWNHDCTYDLFDFLAFVNSFNAGEPEADLTDDGALDLFDFLLFLNLFDARK
jgi:hypothetical protein